MANLTCMALNCTSSPRINEDLRFYQIPCDEKRRMSWIIACKRTDLMDKPPNFFKNQFVCGLHFSNSMYRYKNLEQCATPSIHVTANSRDSGTQTWESITFLGPTPDISELSDLKKIEVRTSQTQTEEFIHCTNHNLEVKDIQCDGLKLKSESKTKEDETELTEEVIDEDKISTDSEQESEDETSEMSIDNFIQLSEGLKHQSREELRNKNIPQTPIKKETKSKAKIIIVHKESQTDNVVIFKIPKNNQCFQQCLRCGKNASRLAPKRVKPEHLFTLEDFESACERFLTPEFCATVKNQIQIEQQLNQLHDKIKTERKSSLDDV